MSKTWYCQTCGSCDIRHEAIARFDADEDTWEVLSLLPEQWCESCTVRSEPLLRCGKPVFGQAPEFTVVAYVPTGPDEGRVYLQRPLSGDEEPDVIALAREVAQLLDQTICEQGGEVPNCSGDLRVEIRRDPDNGTAIWSGQSFYFQEP